MLSNNEEAYVIFNTHLVLKHITPAIGPDFVSVLIFLYSLCTGTEEYYFYLDTTKDPR